MTLRSVRILFCFVLLSALKMTRSETVQIGLLKNSLDRRGKKEIEECLDLF